MLGYAAAKKSGKKNLPPMTWSLPGHGMGTSKKKQHFTKTNLPRSNPVIQHQKGFTPHKSSRKTV